VGEGESVDETREDDLMRVRSMGGRSEGVQRTVQVESKRDDEEKEGGLLKLTCKNMTNDPLPAFSPCNPSERRVWPMQPRTPAEMR